MVLCVSSEKCSVPITYLLRCCSINSRCRPRNVLLGDGDDFATTFIVFSADQLAETTNWKLSSRYSRNWMNMNWMTKVFTASAESKPSSVSPLIVVKWRWLPAAPLEIELHAVLLLLAEGDRFHENSLYKFAQYWRFTAPEIFGAKANRAGRFEKHSAL